MTQTGHHLVVPRGEQLRATRRTFVVGLGAVLGAAVGAACTPSSSPTVPASAPPSAIPASAPVPKAASPAAIGKPTVVKFPTGAAGAVGFAVEVMAKRKIDAKHNITLDIVPLDPAAAEKATLVRQVDAGIFPIISAARVNTEGQNLTVFGPLLWIHYYGLTYADRPYSKLADLKGKKVATLDPVSSGYQSTQVLAAREGLNFEKDFQVVTSPAPAVLAILERGDVEAIFQFEPNIGNLLTTGKYKTFLDYNEEWKRLTGQNMFSIGLAAHDDWVQQNRETAKRLVDAFLESAQLIQSDPTVFEEYASYLNLDTLAKVKAAQERMPRIYPTEWTPAIIENIQSMVQSAIELKILAKAPTRQYMVVL